MSTTRTTHGARAKALALMSSLALIVVGLVGVVLAAPASATPARKVTICHATAAASNPYVTPTVDMSSVDEANNWDWNGHGDHKGPVFDPKTMEQGDKWGDIIPPFTYTFIKKGKVVTVNFPGYNWSAEGQAIYNNGCNVPDPDPDPQTQTKYWCDGDTLETSTSTSTDGGQTWSPFDPAIPSGTETSDKPISCGEDDPIYQTQYRCSADGSGAIDELLQQSTDEGATWSPAADDTWSLKEPTNCGTETDETYWCDAGGNRVASFMFSINGGPWSDWDPQWPEGTETSDNPDLQCEIPVVPDLAGEASCSAGLAFTVTDWKEGTPFRITGVGARTGNTSGAALETIGVLGGPLADGTYSSTLEIPYYGGDVDSSAVNEGPRSQTTTIGVTCKTTPPVVTEEPPAPPVVAAAVVEEPVAAPVLPAQVVEAPEAVAVPAAATLPAAVPAGEGSGNGLPVWALVMVAMGMIGAAFAGKQLLGARK